MKIVLVSDYYAPHVGGGVERVVEEVAVRLAGQGHEVRVLTINPNGYSPREIANGVEVVRLPAINFTRLLGFPAALNTNPILGPYLKDADVIHVHNLFFSLTALTFAARPRAPIVTTMHLGSLSNLRGLTGILGRMYERTLGRVMLERSAAVSAVSRAVARHAAEFGFRGPVDVIPNGVDVERFRPPLAPNGNNGHGPSVLFLGRFSKNKGPQFLVEALPHLLRNVPKAHFDFVGDGPMRAALERRIRDLRLNGQVSMRGRVSDVVPILQQTDVVVRPSLTEGMPLAVMEAMACGRAIVASRVAGTQEIIDDGNNGILVEPGSVESLREGLLRVLKDRESAARIGARARDWAVKQMTWDSITQQYLGLYEEVAA